MIKWHKRFMNIAKEVSTWSKDFTQIGAIIVKDKRILSTGYNGFPKSLNDDKERIYNRELKLKFTIHAELNSLLNALEHGISVRDSTLYVYGLRPCHECAKSIIQSGIKTVVYFNKASQSSSWSESCDLAENMFKESGVNLIDITKISQIGDQEFDDYVQEITFINESISHL